MAVGAAALVPLALLDTIAALAVGLALAGAPFAAQWATTSLALDGVTPQSAGAEAYQWLTVANSSGVMLGSLLAGVLIESAGPSAGFLAGAAAVASAAAVVAARRRTLATVT
jgi:hypothetical protein